MKKILRALLLPAILLLLLTSCNTETTYFNYTFKGEGDTWTGVYKQEASQKLITKKNKVSSESSKRYNLVLRYKGDQSDLEEIKQMKYTFKAKHSSGSQTIEGPVAVAMLKMSASGNGSVEKEDSAIKVTVEWDGKSEEFELKNEK
ncbi:hypothetical protein [Paenibacillus sp. FSL R7-0337]|uniref:hypothetical protein n=1 Tax=Paenibacillus sp. FSL R7-0337 TaxID=1926588 RepID=UPI00096E1FDD|nr:hypothetical protein [Paenibacillus sp. FSL R7-0337]OMF99312.1 hypothetical protein BK147_06965 [Paenibacillus sp. FSL R7-0337]